MRPSDLMDVQYDPYSAYCLDEACAYILEQTMRRRVPKFPVDGDKPGKQSSGRTTNAELAAQMRRENQRYKEAGLM